MKRLVIVLVVLAVLLVAALFGLSVLDSRVREAAEVEAQNRLAAAMPISGVPTVTIDAFPFVLGVLTDGTVDSLTVELADLETSGVRLGRARVTIRDLQINRDLLVESQALEVVGIGDATIEGWVTAKDISAVAPVPVKIEEGRIEVTVRGETYAGTAKVLKHAVYVNVEGMPPFISPLPEQDYLPCEPELNVVGSEIHISCDVDELPPAVARVLAHSGPSS